MELLSWTHNSHSWPRRDIIKLKRKKKKYMPVLRSCLSFMLWSETWSQFFNNYAEISSTTTTTYLI